MPECATKRIQTGPDSYIVINETDYEDFKFMEYTPKEQVVQIIPPDTQETQSDTQETTPTKRRKTVEE
jgi:hypothetical protein